MASGAKIFHLVILGLVGVIVIIYCAFYNGDATIYHIENYHHENIIMKTANDITVTSKFKETNHPISPPDSSVIQRIHSRRTAERGKKTVALKKNKGNAKSVIQRRQRRRTTERQKRIVPSKTKNYNAKSVIQRKESTGTRKRTEPSYTTIRQRRRKTTVTSKMKDMNVTVDNTIEGIPTENLYQSGHDIASLELCPDLGAKLKVLVGVMSAPRNQKARMAIRQTWGHYGLRKDVSLGFIVGTSKTSSMNNITTEESKIYGDIIRGRFMDSYDNLTLKMVSFLEWIDNYCSQVHFVLKTDDDMFINFIKLLSFINKHWESKNTIFGRLAREWSPHRNRKSKYFLSPKQFSHPVLPDFTTGPAYLFTGDIVHNMYRNALKTAYLKLEDVFTTGVVAESINVKRIRAKGFTNTRLHLNDCDIKKIITIHEVKFDEQLDLWKKLLDGRSKCK